MLRSVKEVAAIFGVGRDSVIRLIRNGELGAVQFPRMGGTGRNLKRMVADEEIERFRRVNGG